jgi:hypothetical protein
MYRTFFDQGIQRFGSGNGKNRDLATDIYANASDTLTDYLPVDVKNKNHKSGFPLLLH